MQVFETACHRNYLKIVNDKKGLKENTFNKQLVCIIHPDIYFSLMAALRRSVNRLKVISTVTSESVWPEPEIQPKRKHIIG